MRSILSLKQNKKGQQVISLITGVVIGIMIFIFTIFAVLFGISKLNPTSFFTANTVEANATAALQANLSQGIGLFSQQVPTAFVVLGVVFILSFLGILIFVVVKFGQNRGGSLG